MSCWVTCILWYALNMPSKLLSIFTCIFRSFLFSSSAFLSMKRAVSTSLIESMKVKLLSRVWLFATPRTIVYQAPPSMGFSRQEYWSGLQFPSPGDLPDPNIEPGYPALRADALTSEPLGEYKWIDLPAKVSIHSNFLGFSKKADLGQWRKGKGNFRDDWMWLLS